MKIIIWGAGNFGKYIKKQLEEREEVTLLGFIDRNIPIESTIEGLKVISVYQAQMLQADLVLVAIREWYYAIEDLIQMNVNNIGIIKTGVYYLKKKLSEDILKDKNILWLKEIDLQKPFIKHLETNIMDGCNLNCKGCSHFSNLFNKDAHISFETFCSDLKQIARHAFIVQFYLLGGEPLLNERLTDYIEFSRKVLPMADIDIVSNGLLIPKQSESFFDCCKENDISISISGYKPTLLIKEKIVDILEKNNIKYVFRGDVLDFGKNIDLQGKADPKYAFKRCRESSCHFFRNGKLYKCPFQALGNKFFAYYGTDIQLDESIDIYNSDLDWNELAEKLDKEPINACCYCGEEERIEWKIENHPVLEDWVIRK